MGPFEVLWMATVFGGFALGYWVAKIQIRMTFKMFSEEMHKQYLQLLERHGIKLNEKGEEMLNEPDYKPERSEGVLQLRPKNRSSNDG